ncbi:hypothetical protein GJ496_003342 [Pomphorhynchus laevis]|nr:hypothetical protein GJ496_003342 [Pomphorhynchus laevis]
MCEARILQREKPVHCPKPNSRKIWVATLCKLKSRGKTQLAMKLLDDPLRDCKLRDPGYDGSTSDGLISVGMLVNMAGTSNDDRLEVSLIKCSSLFPLLKANEKTILQVNKP